MQQHERFRLLSVVGKLYGRVLIKRVRAGTECAIVEEQSGFRPSVCRKQVCETYLVNSKNLFCAFMGLENEYDTIDRHCTYMVDAKSVWSWRKIVESSAEFLSR